MHTCRYPCIRVLFYIHKYFITIVLGRTRLALVSVGDDNHYKDDSTLMAPVGLYGCHMFDV